MNSIQDKSITNVTFINNAVPGLKSGPYTITTTQTTSGSGAGGDVTGSFKTEKKFVVKGTRFALQAKDFHTVFPPKDSQGDYGNSIAHVVLNNKTFPWTRPLTLKAQAPSPQPSWMALLTFTSDQAPEIKTVTLGTFDTDQLPTSKDEMLFYNFQSKEVDEEDSDKCQVIDIDVMTFNQLAPTVSDIGYLAHVREVDVTKKSANFRTPQSTSYLTEGSLPQTTFFSVIAGNRLLATPGKYVVHFVSLEKMGKYLPDAEGTSNIDSKYKYIRLVSLCNWKFEVTAQARTLTSIVKNLNNAYSSLTPITLRLPNVEEKDVPTAINQAYAMGYSATQYNMRGGDTNIAWYRGPLLPYKTADNVVKMQNNSPDALIRYNPDDSMFDVSYAASWQLGLLLAIQNTSFAQALYIWKKETVKNTIQALERSLLAKTLQINSVSLTSKSQINSAIMSNITSALTDCFCNKTE